MVGLHGADERTPTALRPTGDRATRTVRAVAERHRERLGDLRHVESGSPPPRVIVWTAAVLAVLSVVVALQGGGIGGIAAVIASYVLIAVVILAYLGGEKVLVLDRGIVIGSFAPFLSPYALGFDQIDARTISANLTGARGVGLLTTDRGFTTTNRTAPWSLRSVSFTALAPGVVKHQARQGGSTAPTDPRFFVLWLFSVRHARRLDPFVHALAAAMRAAGTPGADGVVAHALPPRRLRRTVADAEHLGIPVADRAKDLR
ncbi:hypothetical protein [Oerskovia jenensis]|uniref:hypothetical protein n=1 Tax=Oerskovia jenensis TaxID=162169 RepID=UPI0036D9C125